MHRSRAILPVATLLLLAACDPGATPTPSDDSAAPSDFDLVLGEPGNGGPVVLNRWVGYVGPSDYSDNEDERCDWFLDRFSAQFEAADAPSGWTARPLFAVTDADDWSVSSRTRVDPADIPTPLRYWCVVEGAIPAGSAAAYEALARNANGGDSFAAPDAVILSPAGIEDDLGPYLEGQFSEHAKRHDPTTPGCEAGAVTTRLVLFDTAPTGLVSSMSAPDPSLGGSEHGYALGQVAETLLCEDGTGRACVAELSSRIAMPYRLDGPTIEWALDASGAGLEHGQVGTLSWLAQSIRREVVARQGAGEQLVFNLSLAWNPVSNGYSGTGWEDQDIDLFSRSEVGAVYAAIRDAQCNGAMVLAAAGNTSPFSDDLTGPLLPAAWAGEPLESAPSCQELGTTGAVLIPSADIGAREGESPLYAVSGIDQNDQPLLVSRPDSDAPIAAFGQAATTDLGAGDYSSPMTGTSVSTLVASATMAAQWALATGEEPATIASTVQGAGPRLPLTLADAFTDAPTLARETHRIDLCAVDGGACCVDQPNPVTTVSVSGTSAAPAVTPGPAATSPISAGFILPQPMGDGCPPCSIQLSGGFLAEPEVTLNNAQLTVTSTSAVSTVYPLGTLTAGAAVAVPLDGMPADIEGAVLSYQGEVASDSHAWEGQVHLVP
jgi:hypothetical protein